MDLILQHWDSLKLPAWAAAACATIKAYASSVGAEYRLLGGHPVHKDLGPTAQKLCLLQERFDEYDQVVMLDADMVATQARESVFEHDGIGRLHLRGMEDVVGSASGRDNPALYKKGMPMFFGNCIKLHRSDRQTLRGAWDTELFLEHGNANRALLWDESILHYLIHTTTLLEGREVVELPHAKFCDLPEEASPSASLLHFCRARKAKIVPYLRGLA